MTSKPWIVLLVAGACGNDTGRPSTDFDPPDSGVTRDGEVVSGSDASIAPDSAVLTICQQATLHSDFAWLQQYVFTPSCASSSCHGGPSPEVGLNLSAGAAYANLVNKGASTVGGWTRVVPGSVAQSYLAVSLGRADGPPPRDGFMPLGADPLCVEKLEAIERWIVAGALP
jgi:hypothetical protein